MDVVAWAPNRAGVEAAVRAFDAAVRGALPPQWALDRFECPLRDPLGEALRYLGIHCDRGPTDDEWAAKWEIQRVRVSRLPGARRRTGGARTGKERADE